MHCPSHPPSFDHSNDIWCTAQIIKLLITQFSPVSRTTHHTQPSSTLFYCLVVTCFENVSTPYCSNVMWNESATSVVPLTTITRQYIHVLGSQQATKMLQQISKGLFEHKREQPEQTVHKQLQQTARTPPPKLYTNSYNKLPERPLPNCTQTVTTN
jgi:hypothetical protein